MSTAKKILISLKAYSGHGAGVLKLPLTLLSKEIKILRLSSVYKVYRPAESLGPLRDLRSEERLDGISMIVLAESELAPEHIMGRLANIEKVLQANDIKKSISLDLLVYGVEVLVSPQITLPHPEMHLHPEEIVPAVEVWGDYQHPILGLSMQEIARNFVHSNWGEFIAQGEALLDF